MNNDQKRWKSWAVWASALGALGLILESTGVFEKIGWDSVAWNTIINAVGTILVAFGILNNPTNGEGF